MARPPRQACDLAAACLDSLLAGDDRWQGPADELAQLAAEESGDPAPYSSALFAGVVEPLADRFEPRLAEAYAEFFSRVLDRLEQAGLVPAGRNLQERRERLRRGVALEHDPAEVVVLSRVTVGADAAVTSPLIAGALARWPGAEIVFVGDPRSASLFAGEPRVRALELSYPRRGPLRARIDAWRRLREILGSGSEGRLILDADTRWTQSGLLPLTNDDRGYAFFESRSYRPDSDAPLGVLAAEWFSESFGGLRPTPRLMLAEADLRAGRETCGKLSDPVAVVNFGVGGNEAKRVDSGFEAAALGVLDDAGYAVLLDAGWGDDELARARALAESANTSVELWQGSVSRLAGLIAAADLYFGYDSAGAHLAAAAGTRTIDVFAGAVSDKMRTRWTPSGPGRVDVVPVESAANVESILAKVRELVR